MAIWLKDVEMVPLVCGHVSRTTLVEAMRIVYNNRVAHMPAMGMAKCCTAVEYS